jgi:tetratricopeptide (TPR) repeat protein
MRSDVTTPPIQKPPCKVARHLLSSTAYPLWLRFRELPMSEPSRDMPSAATVAQATPAPAVPDPGGAISPDHAAPTPDAAPLLTGGTGIKAKPPVQVDASLPQVPGYETLVLLGRGGMGVVYKARQIRLDRIVAVKMILAGAYATEEHHERFRTEAEAIARLQHPNIVQVYEVGEHDGLPFFSLEYCDGGSLSKKLQGTPLPPREAAGLVQALAQAVQAAHDKGILRRDLKPANVLLTEDGTPKITDFGLARKLDDAARTATGAVLGTPSYMAPEQAGGKVKTVAKTVDIYGLGAILYECLTGRPPFNAATPVETLQLVLEHDPASVISLNARVPRDLETICLKCLHKEPGKRYATAADLAEDLRRFQAGEPILARRVGSLERTWRWCRRNPALALSTAACLLLLVGLLAVMLGSLLGMTSLYLSAEEHRQQAEKDREQARAQEATAIAERGRADKALVEAQAEHKRADQERNLAEAAAEDARRRKKEAEDQAQRAQQVTSYLVGLFEASDPLGLNGFIGGLVSKPGEGLTAKELLERGAKRITAKEELAPRVRADILDTLGNVHRSQGQHAEAEALLQLAYKLRQDAKAPPGEIAASLHSLAWLRHEQGQYPQAVKMYRQALELRLAEAEADPAALANTEFNLGWVLTEMEMYDEAERLFKSVIARRLKHFGPDHRETAMGRMALASLYLDSDRATMAYPLTTSAIATFKKLGEDKNIVDAMIRFHEGVIAFLMLHNNAAAEKKLEETLELVRKALGPRHMYVILPLAQLAIIAEDSKKYPQAEAWYSEAYDLARERVGLAHPKILVMASGLARLKHRRGQDAEVEEMFQEILQAHKHRFGENDPFVAEVLLDYAEFLRLARQTQRQEEMLQKAAAIYRTPEGLGRRRAPKCIIQLGHALYRQQRYAASEPIYREALELLRERYSKASEDMVYVLEKVADVRIKQAQYTPEVDTLLTEAEKMLPALPKADRGDAQFYVVVSRCNYWRVKDGKHAEPASLLRDCAKTMPKHGWRFEELALQMAQCAELAQKAPDLSETQRTMLLDDYAQQAVAWLRLAWQRGVKGADWENHSRLAALRQRDDFQQLLADIGKK